MITITLKTQPEGCVSPFPRAVVAQKLREAAEWLLAQDVPSNAMERERTLNLLRSNGDPLGIVTLTECLPGCLLFEGHDDECLVFDEVDGRMKA